MVFYAIILENKGKKNMTKFLKTVAVYCGHQFGNNPEFNRAAIKLGGLLAQNNIQVVFGGGDVGLMGAVSTAALRAGGHVIGVSTDDVIARQEPAHNEIDVEIVDGVNERKQRTNGNTGDDIHTNGIVDKQRKNTGYDHDNRPYGVVDVDRLHPSAAACFTEEIGRASCRERV